MMQRSMQDVINDIGTINAAILEYVQTKIKEESFFRSPTDEIDAELSKIERGLEKDPESQIE